MQKWAVSISGSTGCALAKLWLFGVHLAAEQKRGVRRMEVGRTDGFRASRVIMDACRITMMRRAISLICDSR